MTCPHFSRRENACALAEESPKDEEELSEAPAEDLASPAWCVGTGNGYRNCPVFRRFISDLIR